MRAVRLVRRAARRPGRRLRLVWDHPTKASGSRTGPTTENGTLMLNFGARGLLSLDADRQAGAGWTARTTAHGGKRVTTTGTLEGDRGNGEPRRQARHGHLRVHDRPQRTRRAFSLASRTSFSRAISPGGPPGSPEQPCRPTPRAAFEPLADRAVGRFGGRCASPGYTSRPLWLPTISCSLNPVSGSKARTAS